MPKPPVPPPPTLDLAHRLVDELARELGHSDGDDMLIDLAAMQRRFRSLICKRANKPTPEHVWRDEDRDGPLTESATAVVEAAIGHYCTAVAQEAAELRDWTRWKDWSTQLGNKLPVEPGSTEWLTEVRKEIAYLMAFTLNLAAWVGLLSGREVFY